ncbi:hypothetical protein BKA93DRAFT_593458 [Sparassis latifolia]
MCSVRLGVGIYLTAWPCVSLRWVFFPWNFSLGLYVVHRSECGSVSDICVRRRYYADLYSAASLRLVISDCPTSISRVQLTTYGIYRCLLRRGGYLRICIIDDVHMSLVNPILNP